MLVFYPKRRLVRVSRTYLYIVALWATVQELADSRTPETKLYDLETPASLWRTWRRTVPRDMTLNRRLVALVAFDVLGRVDAADADHDDTAAALDDNESFPLTVATAEGVPNVKLGMSDDRLALVQIRKHVMRASQQIGSDPDAAREELREITNLLESAL